MGSVVSTFLDIIKDSCKRAIVFSLKFAFVRPIDNQEKCKRIIMLPPKFAFVHSFDDREKCKECCENCQYFAFEDLPYCTIKQKPKISEGCSYERCGECDLCSVISCISCQKIGLTLGSSHSTYVQDPQDTNKKFHIYICNECHQFVNPKYEENYRDVIKFVVNKQREYSPLLRMVCACVLPKDLIDIVFNFIGVFEFEKYKLI